MTKLILKAAVLILLTLFLVILFIANPISSNKFEKVKIVEKYYTPHSKGTAKGITTKKSVAVSSISKGDAACVMEFNNGKVLEMDCDMYLNYSVGENVKIKYKKNQLLEIRRK